MPDQHLIVPVDDLGNPETTRSRSEEARELEADAEEQDKFILVVDGGRGTHPAERRFSIDLG